MFNVDEFATKAIAHAKAKKALPTPQGAKEQQQEDEEFIPGIATIE